MSLSIWIPGPSSRHAGLSVGSGCPHMRGRMSSGKFVSPDAQGQSLFGLQVSAATDQGSDAMCRPSRALVLSVSSVVPPHRGTKASATRCPGRAEGPGRKPVLSSAPSRASGSGIDVKLKSGAVLFKPPTCLRWGAGASLFVSQCLQEQGCGSASKGCPWL